MPRKKSAQPAYQYHVSGQAVVRLDYRDYYLGQHDTPESYARYYALLAEYNANGRRAPLTDRDMPQDAERLAEVPILVKDVVADFRERELKSASKRNQYHYGRLCDLLVADYGNVPVDAFGPRALEELRDRFVTRGIGKKAKPNCRRQANDHIRSIIRIIEHGVSRELVGPERIVALRSLKPLKIGQAKDNPPRQAVPLEVIAATMPELSPTLQAMVRLQLATAARPGEIHTMRPCDIDRSDSVWWYRPAKHKTERFGKTRSIPLVGDAIAAISPFLFGPADEPCFRNAAGSPWNKDTYRRAIARAAERAKTDHWSPYQIRRTSGQAIRDQIDVESLQALYGHSDLSTTDIYTRASEARAVQAAKVAPKIG